MTRYVAVLLSAVLVSGCASSVEGAAVPEPTKLDCNLIFPGPLDVSP